MEVPRPGVKSELQLPAYTTATATWDLSQVCTYTTAHSNAGSLTHAAGLGMEPVFQALPRSRRPCCSTAGTLGAALRRSLVGALGELGWAVHGHIHLEGPAGGGGSGPRSLRVPKAGLSLTRLLLSPWLDLFRSAALNAKI